MAESVVAQPPQRFYCHKCNVEIENVSTVSKIVCKNNSTKKICPQNKAIDCKSR